MIYELRVYRVVQGRMAALLTRFEHQTLPIMVRHGILQVGFWTQLIRELLKKLVDWTRRISPALTREASP